MSKYDSLTRIAKKDIPDLDPVNYTPMDEDKWVVVTNVWPMGGYGLVGVERDNPRNFYFQPHPRDRDEAYRAAPWLLMVPIPEEV